MAKPADLLLTEAIPPTAVQLGSVHEVTIEKLVYGGEGLARIGTQAVFVPLAAPGDRLRVRIVTVERNFARAVIEEVLEAAPVRRTPPCPHFGVCGGCQLQHLDYAAQLVAKAEVVRESLRRLGGIEWAGEIKTCAADEFAYRSRAEIKVERDELGQPRPGFFKAGTHEVCEVNDCPILLPSVNRELQRLHAEPTLIPGDATRVYLTAGDDEVIVTPATGEDAKSSEVDALGTAHQRIAGFNYEFGVRSFFQSNRLLVEELVRTVVEDKQGELAVDLYAGVGLFSLPLASRFKQVCAVEGNRAAAQHGVENARANNVTNVRYETVSVEAWLKYKAAEQPRPDLVVLDPPRAGAGATVIERLAALAPPQVVYVSCDPATLARDLKMLVAYGYGLETITVFDMFPQTFHVETAVELRLGNNT
jgi:23S rRNA (uracil1939-C5)-methyltransferase